MAPVITLQPATAADRSAIVLLLQSLLLPTEDLPHSLQHFLVAQESNPTHFDAYTTVESGSPAAQVVGSVGLEVYDSYALLRSLAVTPHLQSTGLGKTLYRAAMALAKEQAVAEVYLITTTAASFFEKQGFRKVARASVPIAIQRTAQFSLVCPASATIMSLNTH